MNSLQISKILNKDYYSNKYFKGVFAFNELPKTVDLPSSYIFNTDVNSKPGQHWISIFFNSKGKSEFFDSYGLPPETFGFANFLKEKSISYSSIKKPIQSISSEYCGFYCILFILFRSRNYSLNYFLTFFTSDTNINDRLIKELINFIDN